MSDVFSNIAIQSSVIEPPKSLMCDDTAQAGGYVSFGGIVRCQTHGRAVERLEYECYREMAEKELGKIVAEASQQFRLRGANIRHRVGTLKPGDVVVLIETWSDHRDEAFAGCRYIIDELKKRAPIWKKEFFTDGESHWVRGS